MRNWIQKGKKWHPKILNYKDIFNAKSIVLPRAVIFFSATTQEAILNKISKIKVAREYIYCQFLQ